MKSTPSTAAPGLLLTGDVFWIEVDEAKLKPNPFQPRVNFTDPELNDLAASIREHGVLQPILVRPIYADEKKKKIKWYEIVFGERRVRATRLNGTSQIRATVRELSDVESAEIALLENLNSEALTDYEEASGIQMLWREFEKADIPMSLAKMAARLKNDNGDSRSIGFVAKRLKLVGLDDDLLEVAKKHRNVASSLFEIAKVTDKEIRAEALEMVDVGKGFRPVVDFIQRQQEEKKRLAETARPPDKETAQRASANAATGGGNVSRGQQVKGNTAKEAFETVSAAVKESSWKADTIDAWIDRLSDAQRAKLVPEFKRLSERYAALAK